MALGPGLVLAEVAGSMFRPLTPSRRLRLFAPPALPAAVTSQCPVRSCVVAGRRPLRHGAAAGRTCRRELSRAMRRTPWPETHLKACDRRGWCEAPDCSTVGDVSPEDAVARYVAPRRFNAHLAPCALGACRWTAATRRGGGTHLLTRTIASDATYSVAGKRVASEGPAASP